MSEQKPTKQITIRIEGEEKTLIAGLVTWALMRLNVRPAYDGPNRRGWQSLAGDELELERQLKLLINSDKHYVQFTVSENDAPSTAALAKVEQLIAEREAEIAELKKSEQFKGSSADEPDAREP